LDESFNYFQKTQSNKTKINGLISIASLMINKKEAKQSIIIFKEALKNCIQNDLQEQKSLINNNLAVIYNEILYKPDSALYYLKEDLKYLKLKKQSENICLNLVNQSSSYSKKNDLNTAINLLEEANNIKLSSEKFETKFYINNYLYQLYQKKSNYLKALNALKKSNEYRDSLELEKQKAAIIDIQTKYETEKKELENQNLILDNNRKQVWIYLFIGLILSGGFISYLKYKNRKRKEKILLQEQEIQKQKLEKILKNQELESIEAMLIGQEKERIKLAEDLHDNLGSLLATVKLNFQNLNTQKSKIQKDVLFQKTDILLEEAYLKVRSIAHIKNAGVIANQGLVLAVENIATKMSIPNTLKINVNAFGLDERLENTLEISIFRMIQELLANVIKHANATIVNIEMTQHEDSLTIIIEDNGKGFDYKKINKTAGMGLSNIDKKIDYLGGTFSVDSFIGKGTTIIFDIPKS